MDAKTAYAIVRGADEPMTLPHWDDLTGEMQDLIEKVFAHGIHAAASYVDGNWASAGEMAEHLHDVADGKKPMYAE